MSGSVHLSLLVACFNEEQNVAATLDTLRDALDCFQFPWEIIVIDDGSTDATSEKVLAYISKCGDDIRLITNSRNAGLAQVYIDGAFHARGEYYRLVCGDNVEPSETFVTIFSAIGNADVVIPYHVGATGRSWLRRTVSRSYTMLINAITDHKIRYYNGLAVYRRKDVMRWHTNCHGFGFQADLLLRVLDVGRTYVEIPVQVNERVAGVSSAFRVKNILSVAHTLIDISIRRVGQIIYPERKNRAPLVRQVNASQN